jgi:hypothetical protein
MMEFCTKAQHSYACRRRWPLIGDDSVGISPALDFVSLAGFQPDFSYVSFEKLRCESV